jgi:hypothetical protein
MVLSSETLISISVEPRMGAVSEFEETRCRSVDGPALRTAIEIVLLPLLLLLLACLWEQPTSLGHAAPAKSVHRRARVGDGRAGGPVGE